jgi:hypothetical protein
LTLNLPFEIPSDDHFPFVSTLEEKYQEVIWLAEHALYVEDILEELGDYQQIIEDNLRGVESALNSDFDGMVDYLIANEEMKSEERISWNTLTEEEIASKIGKRSDWTNESALARIQKRVDEYQNILKNPRELVPEYFWETDLEEFHLSYREEFMLGHLADSPEHQDIVDRYHVFCGRDPENERAKSSHRANWSKAQELANTGKTSMLQELQKLSVEAETAVAAGKRITSQDGDCYVCGKFIPHFGGELIIWNEIPREYFYGHLGGKYQKWRVRHFSGECSQDKYGKRIQLVHIKGHTGYRNERADKCWLCEVDVPVDAGWLVLVDQIPKWKHSKRAFPGAKLKKYYVQCEKVDA